MSAKLPKDEISPIQQSKSDRLLMLLVGLGLAWVCLGIAIAKPSIQ